MTTAGRISAVLTIVVAFAWAPASSHARASAATKPAPMPVVVDTDMTFDDVAALAYLGQAHRLGLVDLRAVAVETSGMALPGNGLSQARCLLDKLGLPDVPVADGSAVTPNNWPEWARMLLDGIVEAGVRSDPAVPCTPLPTNGGAVRLLNSAIRSSPHAVTLITLGPLSNVAEALARDPRLAARIKRVHFMGLQLDWSRFGNEIFDAHDYNIWADPPAAQAVLEQLHGRIFVTSQEASFFVPLTTAFRERLATEGTTPAATSVHTIVSHPLLVPSEAENDGGGYWWDPLAAVAATVRGVVRYESRRVRVVQSGANEGRTFVDQTGALVHYGMSADSEAFQEVFLDVLNGRLPAR